MNWANFFTGLRIICTPLYWIAFTQLQGTTRIAAVLAILAFAALTDLLDGFFARRLNQHTRTGELLDPVADKMLSISVVLSLALGSHLPAWMAAIFIFRDTFMLVGGGIWTFLRHMVPAADRWGKTTTVLFYTATFITLFDLPGGAWLFGAALSLSLFSLTRYMRKTWRLRHVVRDGRLND